MAQNKTEVRMHPYVISLRIVFEKNANPADAAPMKKYMREQFEFLGIKTPLRVALQKEFVKEHGLPLLNKAGISVHSHQFDRKIGDKTRTRFYFHPGIFDRHQIMVGYGGYACRQHRRCAFQTLSKNTGEVSQAVAQG
jgi:hypothetical protein